MAKVAGTVPNGVMVQHDDGPARVAPLVELSFADCRQSSKIRDAGVIIYNCCGSTAAFQGMLSLAWMKSRSERFTLCVS
ncbi:MAG: hypothetical protein N2C14_02880 [Planctomycetales bacterium]